MDVPGILHADLDAFYAAVATGYLEARRRREPTPGWARVAGPLSQREVAQPFARGLPVDADADADADVRAAAESGLRVELDEQEADG